MEPEFKTMDELLAYYKLPTFVWKKRGPQSIAERDDFYTIYVTTYERFKTEVQRRGEYLRGDKSKPFMPYLMV